MRAAVVHELLEDVASLGLSELPEPAPSSGHLLVEVEAAACNFFDRLRVQGRYQVKPPLPFVPGAEIAGRVRAVGEGVEGWAAGDRVMASLPHGGYQEVVNVPALAASRVPESFDAAEAAAFPIVYGTSYAALVHRGRLAPGERLLVTAAAGGVGLAAIQIGKALGATVLALAGGEEKLRVAHEAGADHCFDYGDPAWVEKVRGATEGAGVDVVVENVGGDVFEGCMKLLRWGARLVVVGFAGGRIPEVKMNRVLLKHVSLVGLHWGPMLLQEPATVVSDREALGRLAVERKVRPRIWRRYPFERVGEALAALGSRQSHGKIVIDVAR